MSRRARRDGRARLKERDRDKPIFYQGDTGGANLGSKDGELAGSVVITQGTLTIHADRIVFHQNPDNSLSATAYGNPVTFREKRDGVDEYYEGFAQRIVYNGQKRFLELFDRALLKKSGDEIRSNYITYDAGAEVFKAEGRPDSQAARCRRGALGIPRARRVPAAGERGQVGEGCARTARTRKDGKDTQATRRTPRTRKDSKPATTPKPPPPPPQLKGDTTLAPAPAK